MQSIEKIQCGKYLVAYVLNSSGSDYKPTKYKAKLMAKKQTKLTLIFFLLFFTLIFGDNFFITNFSKLCSR